MIASFHETVGESKSKRRPFPILLLRWVDIGSLFSFAPHTYSNTNSFISQRRHFIAKNGRWISARLELLYSVRRSASATTCLKKLIKLVQGLLHRLGVLAHTSVLY